MSSSSTSKSLRLTFKGDKDHGKKKKKSKQKSTEDPEGSSGQGRKRRRTGDEVSDVEDYGGDDQAWVPAVKVDDVTGPTFLFQSSEDWAHPFTLAFNPTLNALEALAILPPEIPPASSTSGQLAELEGAEIVSISSEVTPQSIYQVWVASRIAGLDDKWTFRGADGKYLGCDKYGVVKSASEARGPQEEWQVVAQPGSERLALRSVHGGYLTLDQVAGGKRVVRADAESITDAELWHVRVQWKFRHKARYGDDASKLAKKSSSRTDKDEAIANEIKTFKSRAGSQYLPADYDKMSAEDRKALRKAQKEGRLAEEMLNRRSKVKSDKYAW